MKTKRFFKFSVLTLLISLLGIPSLSNIDCSFFNKEVKASTSEITSYYSGTNNLTGEALLNKLNKIINNGFKSVGYDGLFEAYKYTDVKDDGYLNDIYSNTTKYKVGTSRCGNYKKEGDCWNREHSIPKSWWGRDKQPQYSDIFILYPSDGYVNGRRSNYPLGEVSNITYSSNNSFSKLGSSSISGAGSVVFEPNDQYKGDLARTYFYALTKYDAYSWTSGNGNYVFSGSKNKNFGFTDYALNLFLKWHQLDPVDDWERHRNEGAYSQQNNRNPFIDHPEWVNAIWGGEYIDEKIESIFISGPSEMYVNSSASLTAEILPESAPQDVTWSSSDEEIATVSNNGVVSSYKVGDVIITATSEYDVTKKSTKLIHVINPIPTDVDDIYLNVSQNKITVGGETSLSVTFSPNNVYPTPTLCFESLNANIATVDNNGLVKGISEGQASIRVSAIQNEQLKVSKTIDISVIKDSVIPSNTYKKVKDNNALSSGNYLIVNENKSIIYNSSVDSDESVSNIQINNETIVLNEDISKSFVTILPIDNTKYSIMGTTGSFIGGKNKGISYSNEKIANTISITNSIATISSNNFSLKYNSSSNLFRYYKSGQDDICLYKAVESGSLDNQLISLKIDHLPTKTHYFVGETLSLDGLSISAHYLDGTSLDVTEQVNISSVDMSFSGVKQITISYEDVFTTFLIYVDDVHVSGVNILGNNQLYVSETLKLDVEVLPNNATNKEVIWESSNNQIASVTSQGLVYGNNAGKVTISVTTIDGHYKDFIDIEVLVVKDDLKKAYNVASKLINGEVSELLSFNGTITNIVNGNSLFIQDNEYAIYVDTYNEIDANAKVGSLVNVTSRLINNNGIIQTLYGDATISYIGQDENISSINVTSYQEFQNLKQNVLVNIDNLTYLKGSINQSTSYSLKIKYFDNELSINIDKFFANKYFSKMNELKCNDTFSVKNANIVYSKLTDSYVIYLGENSIVLIDENKNYAREFCNNMSISDDETEPLISDWLKFKEMYNNLSNEDKEQFSNATANENGTDIEKCVALYDKILKKYGDNKYEDFMGRAKQLDDNQSLDINNEQIMIFIVLCGSLLVVASFTIYLFKSFKVKSY